MGHCLDSWCAWANDLPLTYGDKKVKLKSLARRGICAALFFSYAVGALAAYPDRPIHIVVPFAPGATIGSLAQILADRMSKDLGQPVVMDYKSGAGGNIGAEAVARAPADGYTLLLGTISILTINPTLFGSLPFDAIKDFRPLSMVATTQNVLVVQPEFPANNVAEFLSYTRQKSDALTFGSSGTGSTMHLAGEVFNQANGTRMKHVPYRGGGPARADLLGGHISLMFSDLSALPLIKSGKLRALAVTGPQREAALPDVPTMMEAGLTDLNVEPWYGLLLPANTPDAVAARLNASLSKILRSPDVRKSFEEMGVHAPDDTSPAAMQKRIAQETARWSPLIKSVGMRPD